MEQLSLDEAIRIAGSIEDSIREYADQFDVIGFLFLPELPFDKKPNSAIRASLFHKCPKLAAAISKGIAQELFDDTTKYKFLLAHYASMMAKGAIRRGFTTKNNTFRITHRSWGVHAEHKVNYLSVVSGTVDLLLTGRRFGQHATQCCVPVEIKKTNMLRSAHIWQTICYMKALETTTGIVLTLFPGQSSDFRAWVVYRVEGGYRVFWGPCPVNTSEAPAVDGFDNFFSDQEFDAKMQNHIEWSSMNDAKLKSSPGPHENPFDSECVRDYRPAELYKKTGSWGVAGTNKANSGVMTGLCPLYSDCHRDLLNKLGVPDGVTPKVLSVGPAEQTVTMPEEDHG